MSVSVAGNYPTSSKRLFEESERPAESASFGSQPAKRVRLLSSPLGRCTHLAAESFGFHGPAHSAVAALLSLFPDMEEQTVISVLSDCGDNIDAAIKRLSELRLTNAGRMVPDEAPSATPDERTSPATPDASASASSSSQQTAEWVELLVQEMASAKDLDDARARANRVLTMLGKHLAEQGGSAGLLEKVQELQKENHILKRAVQIQNSKLQERSNQEQELQQLRAVLGQYQEQVRTLELNNYSLALHLQKATSDSSVARGHHPPDIC